MIKRWRWVLNLLTRRLWFRAGIYGAVAVVAAMVAAFAASLVPDGVADVFGVESVEDILKILASSMLAVATFSLGTMVNAFSAAASMATPRASKLLVEDSTSQNVLSTFIGAFIFSLVGIIALNTHFYGKGGRAILFFVTIGVVILTLATFFRWIDYLSHLGRLSETIEKVEVAATEAMRMRSRHPYLGCNPARAPTPVFPVASSVLGYVQYVDVAALDALAEEADGAIHVNRLPGAFLDTTEPLAWTTWQPDEKERDKLQEAFVIGNARSFEQDPRFGLIVLSEIASRALSPGVNDPGTAIDIIGRVLRVISVWVEDPGEDANKIEYKRVFVPGIITADLFDDVFPPIARDGAGTIEVGVRLQKAFRSLSRARRPDVRDSARHHSAMALRRSLAALELDEDKHLIQRVAGEVA